MSTITMCDGRYKISEPFARGECAYPNVPAQFAYYVRVTDNDTGKVAIVYRHSDAYQARLLAIAWCGRQAQ